jgi:hypothetical protein
LGLGRLAIGLGEAVLIAHFSVTLLSYFFFSSFFSFSEDVVGFTFFG